VAKPTLRSWLWLGVASIALTSSLNTAANAQIIIGSSGSVHVTDINDIEVPQQFTFTEFTGSRLLMPDPNMDKGPRLHLIDPSKGKTIQLVKPGEKPKGGYALIIPDESQPISLTPPPGTKIYLTPPRSKVAPTQPVKKVAKTASQKSAPKSEPVESKAIATPAPQPAPEPEKAEVTTAPVPAPVADPAPQPETQAKEKIGQDPVVTEAPAAPVEALADTTPAKVEEKTPEPATQPEEKTGATVVELQTPEPPPAPTEVAEVPVPPAIEAPKADEMAVAAPKLEDTATQVASRPSNTTEDAAPADQDAGETTTVALLFGKDDARLNDDHRALIKGVIDQLEADPNSAVQLMAYADANDRSKSRRLSLSRALAVRSYLLKHEVRNTRIQVRAMGDQVKSGKPDRVDLILVKP